MVARAQGRARVLTLVKGEGRRGAGRRAQGAQRAMQMVQVGARSREEIFGCRDVSQRDP